MKEEFLENRKSDHLQLASKSQATEINDQRFYYEPMLSHSNVNDMAILKTKFLGYDLDAPLWISSMTGGSSEARRVNETLARACSTFKLGMGVGSCRPLLESNRRFDDFNLRPFLGVDRPFFANIGIAQIEEILQQKNSQKVIDLIDKLNASGLIIHVNPLQEWLQPEGDIISRPPIDTISEFVELFPHDIIIKEVGQGMGPQSIKELLKLPIKAFDFAAYGGTNFSKLELHRRESYVFDYYSDIVKVGHTNSEMIDFIKKLDSDMIKCRNFIISGGVNSFLDGHYYMEKLRYPCVFAQGKVLLKYASQSYQDLCDYLKHQISGLAYARSYLKIRE